MTPTGTTEPDEIPKSVLTVLVHYTDTVVAPGCGDALDAMHSPSNFKGNYNKLLERLNGVSVDWSNLYNSRNPGKETLYELDSDSHLTGPVYVSMMDVQNTADVGEAQTEIAPWFGNSLSWDHSEPPTD